MWADTVGECVLEQGVDWVFGLEREEVTGKCRNCTGEAS